MQGRRSWGARAFPLLNSDSISSMEGGRLSTKILLHTDNGRPMNYGIPTALYVCIYIFLVMLAPTVLTYYYVNKQGWRVKMGTQFV